MHLHDDDFLEYLGSQDSGKPRAWLSVHLQACTDCQRSLVDCAKFNIRFKRTKPGSVMPGDGKSPTRIQALQPFDADRIDAKILTSTGMSVHLTTRKSMLEGTVVWVKIGQVETVGTVAHCEVSRDTFRLNVHLDRD